jgi:hypothetical protein
MEGKQMRIVLTFNELGCEKEMIRVLAGEG